jgi:dienelactone hydrolase
LKYFLPGHVVVVSLLAVILTACAPPPFGDTEAALALEDIAAANDPSRLKAQTPAPSRRLHEYVIEGRRHEADLYLSPQGARAGIVLLPGVVAAGKDDSRIVALATTLARLRFAVLVPDIEGLRHFQLRATDARDVADAFRYLYSRPDWVPQGRAGIVGFSYGGGPALLAAIEPDIRDQVDFIATFGGYYDVRNIIRYFTTGYFRSETDGKLRYRTPHPYLKQVFTLSYAALLERPADREALYDLVYGIDDMGGDIDPASLHLAPDAQALYRLLRNDDPARVNALFGRLSPQIRSELQGISPADHDLSQLHAKVITMHGRGDTFIPYTESLALQRALPAGQVQLFLIEGYAHTNVRLTRADIPGFLDMMAVILAQRVESQHN